MAGGHGICKVFLEDGQRGDLDYKPTCTCPWVIFLFPFEQFFPTFLQSMWVLDSPPLLNFSRPHQPGCRKDITSTRSWQLSTAQVSGPYRMQGLGSLRLPSHLCETSRASYELRTVILTPCPFLGVTMEAAALLPCLRLQRPTEAC